MHRRWALDPRSALVAIAALTALALAACSGDTTGSAASPNGTATTTAGGSSGTTAPSGGGQTTGTTDPGQAPVTIPDGTTAGVCPALPPVPANALEIDTDRGDFDGDQALDSVTAYKVGGQWKMRVGLTTGGGAEIDVPNVTGEAGLTPLGGANLGGGPGAEVFAVVGQGAATAGVGVFRLEACTLSRVLGPATEPAEFAVGGTVLRGSGLRCEQVGDAVRLLVLEATSSDGTTFTAVSRPMVLQGERLVPAGDPTTRTLTAPADNGALGEFFRITCGGVAEGS